MVLSSEDNAARVLLRLSADGSRLARRDDCWCGGALWLTEGSDTALGSGGRRDAEGGGRRGKDVANSILMVETICNHRFLIYDPDIFRMVVACQPILAELTLQ